MDSLSKRPRKRSKTTGSLKRARSLQNDAEATYTRALEEVAQAKAALEAAQERVDITDIKANFFTFKRQRLETALIE